MPEWNYCLEVNEACQERFIGVEDCPALKEQNIVLAGITLAREHFLIRRSRPDFHVLLFSIRGQGRMLVPGHSEIIEPNTLTLLPADGIHGMELAGEEWETAWFILEDKSPWLGLRQNYPEIIYCEQAMALYHGLNMLYYESRQSEYSSMLVDSCLSVTIQLLQKALLKPSNQSKVEAKLRQLFNQVERQLHYPWTVDELADKLHYSPPHFHRLCLTYLGKSPKQYLLDLKMERAKHLLISQQWSVGQVALALGYFDVSNFSNRFKKHYGVTPSKIATLG